VRPKENEMNSRNTVKTRADAVEKRYAKTTKGTASRTKIKKKVSPILGKDKVGIKLKVKF
jgi:hypothetical protein